MRSFFLTVLILLSIVLKAQLTILIDEVPDYTPADADIYFAGDLNSWNPGDPAYKLEKTGENSWRIILPEMDHGKVILFKFTRGSWESVEKGASGEEIDNRQFTFGNGDTIRPAILNWADNGGGGGSTAAENVSIIDDSFYMPQLDRNRRIWIYLPPDYENTSISYPVLYMHDGQNLFDAQTSFLGEWEIDETLNELFSASTAVPIVVGIDNGGSYRMNEYTPWVNPEYGGGDGSLYLDFLVETLKPFIDDSYRTLPDRNNTAIMGSSLGGLISHYGTLKFQDVFSMAGIFSPSYWWSDSIWDFTSSMGKQQEMKFYQMCGDQEGESTVPDMQLMDTYLKDAGFSVSERSLKVVAGGEHNEQLWRNEFAEAYLWLFSDYISSIPETQTENQLIISPNPATDFISFGAYKPELNDSLLVVDAKGETVINSRLSKIRLDISKLKSGVYLVRIKQENKVFRGKFVKE